MTILLFSFLLTFFSIVIRLFFFFHNLKYRLSMNEVLQKVIRLISRTDLSSRNTVQFFFLDSVSWVRVGWCAKKEWRMRKKKSISFDYDQARFRPVRVSFKQFSVQSRLLWFFLPFSTFLFFFIPARFSLFPFNWHLSFPSVRTFFHLFACLLPHTPPDFSVFSFSVVSHPPAPTPPMSADSDSTQAWNNPGKLNASLEVFLSTSVSAIDDFLISEIGHNAAKRAFFFEFLASPLLPLCSPSRFRLVYLCHTLYNPRYCSRARIDRFFTPFILSSNKKFAIKQRRRICLLFAISP